MNLDLVNRYFAIFAKPPIVTVDDGVIVVGPFTITETVNEVKGLGGRTYTMPLYILEVGTDDGDVMDLHSSSSIIDVLTFAVEQYAGFLARQVEDAVVTEAQAADLKAEQQMLTDAYNEGYLYYQKTPPDERTLKANPYPFGIQHYCEWLKGFDWAAAETLF